MKQEIKCGDKVRCRITGFKGIVTTITEHINGCTQIGITPRIEKDGKYPESIEVDIQQVEKLTKPIRIKKNETGGPIRRVQPKYRGNLR